MLWMKMKMIHILVFPFHFDSDQEQPFPPHQLSREQTRRLFMKNTQYNTSWESGTAVKKTRAGPTGSFTQLYWRLCINTHAHFKCKPKWTQVQPNLETPVMSSCKDVWIIFTKKVPKQQNHPFFKNIPSLTRAQARLCKLVCKRGLEPRPPLPCPPAPNISGLAKVLNILSVYY